jgi:hypothetical protein
MARKKRRRKPGEEVTMAVGTFHGGVVSYLRQDWEPSGAYERFQAFLKCGLGKSRDLRTAYENSIVDDPATMPSIEGSGVLKAFNGRQGMPPTLNATWKQWQRDFVIYRWAERAAKYDAHFVMANTQESATNFLKALTGITRKLVQGVEDPDLKFKSMSEIVEAANAVAALVSPEVLQALVSDADDAGDGPGHGRHIEAGEVRQGPGGVHQERLEDQPDPGSDGDLQPPGEGENT